MNLIQDLYIVFFNHIFEYTKKVNVNIRDWIARICILFLVSTFFIRMILTEQGITKLYVDDLNRIGSLALLLLCISSVQEPLKRVKWKKWIVYPYFAAAVYMTLTSIHHFTGKGYQAYAIQLLVLFPALYFIYGNRKDYDKYFKWISWSAVWIGIATVIATFIFAPINEENTVGGRYMGLTDNPNILAMLMLIITTGTLYKMSLKNKFAIGYAMLTGICTGIIWLSAARTAIIAIVLQILASIVIMLRMDIVKNKERAIRFSISILIVIILSAILSVSAFNIRGEISGTKMLSNSFMPVAYADTEEHELLISDSTAGSRFDTKGKTLDQFSSGRITLWKWYIERMSLLGNDCTDHKVIEPSGTVAHNAHNTFLEIPYRFGIPAGIFYVIFILSVILALMKGALIKANRRYVIFIVLASLAYIIEAMFDVMTLPFERGPVLIFCMALVGVFEGDILKDEEEIL